MKLFGFEIRRVQKKLDTQEELLQAARALTDLWSASYEERLGLSPWVDWETKEVQIVRRGSREVVR